MRFTFPIVQASVLVAFASIAIGQDLPTRSSLEMAARIDVLLNEKLDALGWQAAGPCSDASFIRRAYLDLTGVPPTGSEALDFIQQESVDKRSQLIERLIASPNYSAHLAATWMQWLVPEQASALPFGRPNGLQDWLRQRFAENLRYDRLAADLLVSSGSIESGPTAFFVALESKPEKIAARTARVFMGVQLDCAECHDHPFDQWSQRDFWGFAAYFAQLSTNGTDPLMQSGEVTDVNEGEVQLPGTEEEIAPKPLVRTGLSGISLGTRRQQLTLWLTAKENPFLARATVNRVWSLLMGRGLVEPIDDMRSLEHASHPQLLQELADYFAATGYDLRNLLRTIATTQAYSRNTIHPSGAAPEASYAVMETKPLTETQLAASVAQVARQFGDGSEQTKALLATQLGKLRGDASEAKLGIVNALVTLHGDLLEGASREGSSRLLRALDAPHLDQRNKIRWLFLTTLNRVPSADEEAAFSEQVSRMENSVPTPRTTTPDSNSSQSQAVAGDVPEATSQAESASELVEIAATAVEPETQNVSAPQDPSQQRRISELEWQSDLLWALLNSSEFAMTP